MDLSFDTAYTAYVRGSVAMNGSEFQIRMEVEAARILVDGLKLVQDGDQALLLDAVEGETNLLEAVDAILDEIDEIEVLVSGLREKEHQFVERRRAMEDRLKRFRSLIEQAMAISEQTTLRRPTATLTLRKLPPDVVVLAEADIPSDFYVEQPPPPPKLNKGALRDALQQRALAIKSALGIKDTSEREQALARIPEIPGATLNNGGFSLQIRRA